MRRPLYRQPRRWAALFRLGWPICCPPDVSRVRSAPIFGLTPPIINLNMMNMPKEYGSSLWAATASVDSHVGAAMFRWVGWVERGHHVSALMVESYIKETAVLLVPLLYLTLLYLTLPYLTLPYFTLPCLTLPYPTLPYPTLPCLTLPYLTLPYPTLPYLTLPYLT